MIPEIPNSMIPENLDEFSSEKMREMKDYIQREYPNIWQQIKNPPSMVKDKIETTNKILDRSTVSLMKVQEMRESIIKSNPFEGLK